MVNDPDALRCGETVAEDLTPQQLLQLRIHPAEQHRENYHVQHPTRHHRQQVQQYTHSLEGCGPAEGKQLSSFERRTHNSGAIPPMAASSNAATAEHILPASLSSASSSAATPSASSPRPSTNVAASSDDPSPCTVDSSIEGPALNATQQPSADTCEAPSCNSRNRKPWWYWCLGCMAATRQTCFHGLQYLEHRKARSMNAIMCGFEKYAALVYKYSWLVLIVSVLLTAALSVGVFLRTTELDVYKLYSLKVSPSQRSKERIFSAFPPDRVVQVIVESGKGDLLQEQALQQLANLQATLQGLTIRRDDVSADECNRKLDSKFDRSKYPEVLTYQDLCAVDAQKQCVTTSVLDVFSEPAAYGHIPLLLPNKSDSVIVNPRTGRVFRIDSILAKYELQVVGSVQHVVNAHVALLRMNFKGDEEWRPFVSAFEERITQYILDHRNLTPDLFLTPRADRSATDELHRASTLDLPHWMMLVGAGVLVTIYTSVVNSSLTYRTKLLPSAMGALASLLGYLGGAGAVYLCGVRHTAPADATPFLALGIGVDDLFVIINAFSLTYLYKDPEQRIVSAVRDAGLSITLTTLTNVITFMIGAVCPYYSISGFCLVTAGALCWGYVMCLTFFLAVLCIDARREARKQTLLHALLCMNTPHQAHSGALCITSQRMTTGAAAGGSAVALRNRPEEAALTRADRVGDAVHMQADYVQELLDVEDAKGVAAPPLCAELLASSTETAGPSESAATARAAAAPLTTRVHRSIEADNSLNLESSPVACHGEELLSTHELAALMVLHQNRHRSLRAGHGSSSTQSARHMNSKDGSGGGHECRESKDGHRLKFGSKVSYNSSGSRERHCPQESCESPSQPEEALTVNKRRRSEFEEKIPAENVSHGSSGCDSAEEDSLKNGIHPSRTTQCTSRKRPHGHVEGAVSPTDRLTAEETASLLQHFQRELKENPDRLLSLYHPEPRGNPGRIWRMFFRDYYARMLGSRWMQVCISLVLLALTAASAYGATRLKYGFSLKDITPNASFLRDFYEKHEKYFSQYGDEVVIFFPGTTNLQNRNVQKEYLTVVADIQNTENITAVSDGLSSFLRNATNAVPDGARLQFLQADAIYCNMLLTSARLRTWLQQDPVGRNFGRDFQFTAEGELEWAKFSCWMRVLDNSAARYNLLQQLRRIVQTAGPELNGDVYSTLAIIWESDPQLLSFTLTNLAIALAAILGVSLLMIPNLASAALVVTAVTFVDLCLFGMMGYIQLHLSMISMVTLLISVGYSVDFTLHVTHTFTHCVGSSLQDRISETMVVMGAPVTHGMISTLLAVLALSGSPRYILQIFFKMMLMVVTFSYATGMIFLPTVLSLVGPTGRHRRQRVTPAEPCLSPVSAALCM